MSLTSSLQLASNALQAQQIALQVIGQNIANASTPGYAREEAVLTPAPTQRLGNITLGLGVQVLGVVQKVDKFLEERLRSASSDRASSEAQEKAYAQLEGVLGQLQDTDLNSTLNRFFASVSEILNQPESVSVRNLAVLQGKSLAGSINRLAVRVGEIQGGLDKQIGDMAVDINRLLKEVAGLNVRITTIEGGGAAHSDAVGLRDERNLALSKLAQLIDIRVEEQPSGAANVFTGGDFLVFEGSARKVAAVTRTVDGTSKASVRIVDTDLALGGRSGQLAGLLVARDSILGGFARQLDGFAATLAHEFNKVYTQGQGLSGFQTLTSESAVNSRTQPLDAAGLKFSPVNGAFQVQVLNRQTGLTQTTDVAVDLDGLDDNDTSLDALAAKLSSIPGLTASVNSDGNLTIATNSPSLEFSFGNDSSGVLAALGLNTFFTGSTARDLGISELVAGDPGKFAASRSGIGGDTANAVELARFQDQPLASANGDSLTVLHDRLTGDATQGAAVTHAVAEGFRTFESTLKGQQVATSGVSLDEEAVQMITHQRAFQAAAKYITTLSELLDLLVRL